MPSCIRTPVSATCFLCRFKPVVVLTDLRSEYTFYWLDGHTIHVYNSPDSSAAWGLIDALLSSEKVVTGGVELIKEEEALMPVAKRQKLVLGQSASQQEVGNLSDLEGLISPEELHAGHVSQLLQQFHRLPALEAARSDIINTLYV